MAPTVENSLQIQESHIFAGLGTGAMKSRSIYSHLYTTHPALNVTEVALFTSHPPRPHAHSCQAGSSHLVTHIKPLTFLQPHIER